MLAGEHYRNDIINSLAKPVPKQEFQSNRIDDNGMQMLASLVDLCWSERQHGEVPRLQRETVTLGAISPHHEHDEKSYASSPTPPSYNQLNYSANISRYFNSNPLTSGDCDGAIAISNVISDDNQQPQRTANRYLASTSTSNTGTTDTSDSLAQFDSTDTSSAGGAPLIMLTTELLLKHNDDMEKSMLKQYKETRTGSRSADKGRKLIDLETDVHGLHGVKRCGSQSRMVEQQQNAKKAHLNNERSYFAENSIRAAAAAATASHQLKLAIPASTVFGVAPTISSIISAQCAQPRLLQMPTASGFYPTMYYVPAVPVGPVKSPNVLAAPMSSVQYTSAGMPALVYTRSNGLLYHSPLAKPPSMNLQRLDSLTTHASFNTTVCMTQSHSFGFE